MEFLTLLLAVLLSVGGALGAAYYWCFRHLDPLEKRLDELQTHFNRMGMKIEGLKSDTSDAFRALQTESKKILTETARLRSEFASMATAIDQLEARLPRAEGEPASTSEPYPPQDAETPPGAPPGTPPNPAATLAETLGKAFVDELRNDNGRDFTHCWDDFLIRLRSRYGLVESRHVYWDRAADQKFYNAPSDEFKDTGTCLLLKVQSDSFLFFPALAGQARKVDLPHCRLETSGNPILKLADLLEFTPPQVLGGDEGYKVRREGAAKYS